MEYEDDVLLGSDDYAPEGKRNKRSRNRGIKERKKKEPSLPWSEEGKWQKSTLQCLLAPSALRLLQPEHSDEP